MRFVKLWITFALITVCGKIASRFCAHGISMFSRAFVDTPDRLADVDPLTHKWDFVYYAIHTFPVLFPASGFVCLSIVHHGTQSGQFKKTSSHLR